MSTAAPENSPWLLGGGIALAGHVAVLAGVLLAPGTPPAPVAEPPPIVIELPPLAAAPAIASAQPQQVIEPVAQPTMQSSNQQPIDAPLVRAPLPQTYVATPPPSFAPPQPMARSVAIAPPQPAAPAVAPARAAPAAPITSAANGTAATPGDDPKAKREEADYYAMLSAHLNRKRRYPSEAKKARQQGVVTVRFTVHSDGRISNSSIRKSSGHDLLDQATLDLMERVAPLPKFPRSMVRDSVTITLPIDYNLRTS